MSILPPQTFLRGRCIALSAAILLILAAALLAQDREYFVNGKKVAEPVYRAARLTNDAIPLIELERFEQAKEKLLEALKLAPGFPLARYNLGVVLMKQGQDSLAAAEFAAVVASGAEVPEAWVSLAVWRYGEAKYDDALSTLDDAARRFDPAVWDKIPEYYYNRGLTLGRLGRTQEAIEHFKRVLPTGRETASTLLNLASLYQEAGYLEDSIAHYKELIHRYPQNPDAPVIGDLIKTLEEELRLTKSLPARAGEDYFVAATRGGVRSWPGRSMPLRVYIHGGEHAAGFQQRYVDILRAAFDEWAAASQGRLKFAVTKNLREAHIECLWTSDASQLKNRSEGGEARIYYQEKVGIYDAQIFILTVPVMQTNVVTDRSIRFIALHEIGHALGLLGHSGNPNDIMYFSMSVADRNPDLSARDKRTLLRLYGRK